MKLYMYGGFDRYVGETGTLARKDYVTGVTTNHHGRVMAVENRLITILKSDGSHISGSVDDLRLDNPSKFLR